ncbi:MAG: archaemetzincin family Zn-dependent metalloprotease [Thermoanaerobaculum sp.]
MTAKLWALELMIVGAVPLTMVRKLQSDLHAVLSHPVSIAPERIDPAPAFNPARRQYDAMSLLGMLQASRRGDQVLRLGVTDVDIFLPVFTHLFGLASLLGSAAVVSFYRLRPENNGGFPDQDLLRWRLAKEALHELGHLFGLRHCPVPWCAMASSRSAEEVDLKDAAFCPACAEEMGVVSIPGDFKLETTG